MKQQALVINPLVANLERGRFSTVGTRCLYAAIRV
jgi:hypothetical protein